MVVLRTPRTQKLLNQVRPITFYIRDVTLVKCCASVYCNCSFELQDIKKQNKKTLKLYFDTAFCRIYARCLDAGTSW